ncbi:MAG TPA: methyltransferase [Polyangiaceae bacterium LLY-WYZ-15_(1-7)]|nr:ArsR family transcriptional regulator [Sandaracinus sp.]HJK94473.1 methyltransferase [Polyangiaceae bacterium LLY-WYZ-15_(1-7)]HJL00670.1 methyltransferase [Polyangiaceae bacterium LLY-WYZ-15_(1-7)]HJL08978.1 methyltransferase [Polyangiaceae bacterium LLY-WYZ-15_(1-7)]
MSQGPHGARALFSLLFHGDKAIELVEAAWATGVLAELDAGPVSVGEVAERAGLVPGRLFKLLEGLEALGVVERVHEAARFEESRYVSREPLAEAAAQTVGPESIERDRLKQPWQHLRGRLAEVLRGAEGIPPDEFAWPPQTDEQVREFESAMATGVPPLAESLLAQPALFEGVGRLLDVGGGDGTLAARLAEAHPALEVDVYNLPAARELIEGRVAASPAAGRLGVVCGDFLEEPLPEGYDAISFVRVLHDWPNDVTWSLLEKARRALAPGGRLWIVEELRTPDRLAVQLFWTYFLVGVDGCFSRLRAAEDYLGWLAELGFDEARVLRGGPFEVVAARR